MLKKKNNYIILIILLFIFTSFNTLAQDFNRAPRFNIKGITGDDFIGQASILYPFRNTEDSIWFTDLRYRMSEDDVDEWNIGLGYKNKIGTAGNHIAGIYAFKDRREEYSHYWDMWTIGGEILTDQWDFRLNAYLADNEIKQAPELDTVIVENNQLTYKNGTYASMDGLDIEIGKRFTETETIFKDVGVYAKSYRFFESDYPTIKGNQIRIDKQFGDRDKTTWKIGAQWRDDNIRGSAAETTFTISIPFGAEKTDGSNTAKTKEEILETRMTEQPERDLDIVVGENKRSNEPGEASAYDPATGERMDNIEFISAGADNLAAKINNSETKVIILLGKNGDVILNETIELDKGQKLLSPTGSLLVSADAKGSRTTYFEPLGKQASLRLNEESFTGTSAISLNEYNTVSGLEIVNNSDENKGIYKETLEVNNAPDIRDNKIENFDFGIYFEEISGTDTQNKLDNLKNFDTEYEKMNKISGEKVVDVHDHVIKDWYDLDSIRYNLDGTYLMKADLSSDTAGYKELVSETTADNGWTPIASVYGTQFLGVLDGNGRMISDLYIDREDEDHSGLFAVNYGVINNVSLVDVDFTVSGTANYYGIGGLVSENSGNISNIYVSGNIDSLVVNYVGGIVGKNGPSGKVINSYSDVKIIGNKNVGGLVGWNFGNIQDSYATGDVAGDSHYVGGLVGSNEGNASISHSYAVGDVAGHSLVGGLVGSNEGSIKESYALGDIAGHYYVGGLVGRNYVEDPVDNEEDGSISHSYAVGDVVGDTFVGGLVGMNSSHLYSYDDKSASISHSYAAGYVAGDSSVGGLVGSNEGIASISHSYAVGDIAGDSYSVGGLVGYSEGSIKESYAIGDVAGGSSVGGLVGSNAGKIYDSISLDSDYYEVVGPNNGLFYGRVTDASSSNMKLFDLYHYENNLSVGSNSYTSMSSPWNISKTIDSDYIWYIDEGNAYPVLQWQK